ncbi:Gfo/Idh/MocA family protein [Cohnella candidum]|uniref:Gfo/Idh/MocA family oxidoreductase n=1 Tax=Cohnella candidum TaxID=2674991 RepID=A0A3G3JSK6_9BACL|nr:Gfo/Idh/MocA family oxidoreductase [Cohnella candidum]AYQ71172.1 gfo/Idh/MocA family oxidoreductase [Cohnella candidum]
MRFGIIGTNWIADRFLAAAREVQGFELTAVYSRTEEKAKEFAAKYGAAHTFTDIGQMADSGLIDAVYIASPNFLHAEQSILCMDHGIHVLCEKPAASNAREFRSMAKAAKRNGVVFMEAMKSTLLPNFQAIQENLPKLGKVRRYLASYCQYSSRYDAYKRGELPNAFNPSLSNGSLMDLGVYGIYPLVVLFGKPDAIKASGVLLESGADGEGSILLQYPDMDAVIMYSKITDSSLPSEIQGENGCMAIHGISQPHKVEIRYRDGSTEDLTKPQSEHTMAYEIREFVGLIEAGLSESPTNTHERSLLTLEIMDEARRQIGLVFPADQQ